ncbi:hypothetical protein ACFQXA_09895 [Nocardiopsis composta]
MFLGDDDPEVDIGTARRWADTTTGRVDVRSFPGGHFYLAPGRRAVLSALLRRLDPALAGTAQPWPSTPDRRPPRRKPFPPPTTTRRPPNSSISSATGTWPPAPRRCAPP